MKGNVSDEDLAQICNDALVCLLPRSSHAAIGGKMGSVRSTLVLQGLLAMVEGCGTGLLGQYLDTVLYSDRHACPSWPPRTYGNFQRGSQQVDKLVYSDRQEGSSWTRRHIRSVTTTITLTMTRMVTMRMTKVVYCIWHKSSMPSR